MSMVDTGKEGPWADLMGEALAEVFSRLPFEDRMMTVPLVCKSWKDASLDPACWKNVDMNGWFHRKVEEDYWWELECESEVEFYTRKVVDRSQGQLIELHVTHCSDTIIEHVAENCPSLMVLSIPNSLLVTGRSAAKLAACCPKIEKLDVSDCYNISNEALEAIGRSCSSLMWLSRNMLRKHQQVSMDTSGTEPEPGGDAEAILMSKHMSKLKHLEMKKTSLSDRGLAHLVQGCRQLETLNLACCGSLSPKALEDVSKRCVNLKDFTKPITPRLQVSPPNECMSFSD